MLEKTRDEFTNGNQEMNFNSSPDKSPVATKYRVVWQSQSWKYGIDPSSMELEREEERIFTALLFED